MSVPIVPAAIQAALGIEEPVVDWGGMGFGITDRVE